MALKETNTAAQEGMKKVDEGILVRGVDGAETKAKVAVRWIRGDGERRC